MKDNQAKLALANEVKEGISRHGWGTVANVVVVQGKKIQYAHTVGLSGILGYELVYAKPDALSVEQTKEQLDELINKLIGYQWSKGRAPDELSELRLPGIIDDLKIVLRRLPEAAGWLLCPCLEPLGYAKHAKGFMQISLPSRDTAVPAFSTL